MYHHVVMWDECQIDLLKAFLLITGPSQTPLTKLPLAKL